MHDRVLTHQKHKYRFLFSSAMFGGNRSLFESMRETIGARDDIDSTWLLMESHGHGLVARIPPISRNWTLKGGLSMRHRVLALERQGLRFDAAYFNHLIPAIFLNDFRKRVPSIIAMDVTPSLMDRYGEWYNVPPSSRINPLERLKYVLTHNAYRDAKFLMPFSNWVAESLKNDYNMPPQKIYVNPVGINLGKWNPQARTPSPDKPVRVLFVGSDFHRKGGDLVLRLAAREEFRSCAFHFLSHDNFRPLSENIFIHSNIKPNTEELKSLYRESDIFLLPSRGDLSPVAILEAMAMEMPVIATDVGAVAELVSDGESGFMIPPDDERRLADRLRTLVSDPQLRIRFGKQGRKAVEQNFNLEKTAAAILSHLTMAVEGAKASKANYDAAAT